MVRYLPNDLYPISLSKEEEIKLVEFSIDLKKVILKMITDAKSGHPGGSLSCTDILTCLYNRILHHNPNSPSDPNRDIFIMSKGHAAPALYAILAKHKYFNENLLKDLRKFGSPLQGHPKKGSLPGIEVSTGSLGIGVSIGVGMALAAKMDKKNSKVYVLLGDGECDEGIVWEAAMSAAHYNLDNLIFIIDRNALQLDGSTEKVMSIEPFCAKWESFNWNVIEVDGNSIRELIMAFETAKLLKGKPTVVIAYMIKGQGVSFMSHVKDFHGNPPTKEEFEQSDRELDLYKKERIEQIMKEPAI
jgi:transketolase